LRSVTVVAVVDFGDVAIETNSYWC
jgi:hypothetical protein